jgi:hypothetical protein
LEGKTIGASVVNICSGELYFFKGLLTKYYRLVALSLTVIIVWRDVMVYFSKVDDSISWEGI